MDGPIGEFTDHYKPINNGDVWSGYAGALAAADGDKNRVWFIRHGDACECVADDEEDFEETWDVELADGQYVNCVGYFVTTEPCKDEHRGAIFTY